MFDTQGKVPAIRLRALNDRPIQETGTFVLYWMTAYRRPFDNFALQHAVAQAHELKRPLVILEALRCDYPHASERIHSFILQGMADNAAWLAGRPVSYYPFVETVRGAGKGLIKEMAASACLIVTDDYPAFFLPKMLHAAAAQASVRMEAVDSNGLLPLRATEQAYPSAYAFRRFLQKNLPGHLFNFPQRDPLAHVDLPLLEKLPEQIRQDWPEAVPELLEAGVEILATLPLDHAVLPTKELGGWQQAEKYLKRFLTERLPRYQQRSEPDLAVSSELSPYLHFGQISAHQIFRQIAEHENWSFGKLSPETRGKRSGWWGMSAETEAFVDQLITWRELGFNACTFLPGYDQYQSLPGWARESLEKHRDDPRPYLYSLDYFEQARTHDPLWNAAQNQLVREGRIHNYLRMLWGKKILEWSPDPESALRTMLYLNDKYALDGRDPNSCSGIFWCLGRYDRAWGPERPIYGKIRYMTSENTARKFSVKKYLAAFGSG
jgi:deoxyribodipyrimidine photo-lyase